MRVKEEKIQESWGPDVGKGGFPGDLDGPRKGRLGMVTGRPHPLRPVDQIAK